MARALRRFDNKLKRFWALVVAPNVILFAFVAQAQQPSTNENTRATSVTPTQLPQENIGPRIQAVRVTDAIKIDGLLDEPVCLLTARVPVPQAGLPITVGQV
jgi:hypothetical protein